MIGKPLQRALTERAFVDALRNELAAGRPLRAETIARQAGANKSLLYRYFGSIDGLIRAYASSNDFMPDFEEVLAHMRPMPRDVELRAAIGQLVEAYVLALEKRPATVQVLLEMHTYGSEVLRAIEGARSTSMRQVAAQVGLAGASSADALATFNLMLAGACVLLRSRRLHWNGAQLAPAELVAGIRASIQQLVG
jgi:AcrR family transcriptional regulator